MTIQRSPRHARGGDLLWVGLLLVLLTTRPVAAQVPELAPEPGWRPLLQHQGVVFRYIFYQEADSRNDGLVLRLTNTNPFAVRYRFTIVFRSGAREHEEVVSGYLRPQEDITGELEGLFWVPFLNGDPITEVGLRGYSVVPSSEDG